MTGFRRPLLVACMVVVAAALTAPSLSAAGGGAQEKPRLVNCSKLKGERKKANCRKSNCAKARTKRSKAKWCNAPKSRPVNVTLEFTGQEEFSGTASGGPFGSGTVTGKLVIPDTFWTWKYEDGTVKVKATATQFGADLSGTWTATGGTRAYAKIKGRGTFAGPVGPTSRWVFKGLVRY